MPKTVWDSTPETLSELLKTASLEWARKEMFFCRLQKNREKLVVTFFKDLLISSVSLTESGWEPAEPVVNLKSSMT